MIKDNKFENEILEKLKEEKLHPKPRWHFLLKNYVVWSLGALSLLVGGLAFSVIIYLFRFNDWEVYDRLSGSLAEFVLLTLPYFWIVLLSLFIVIVNYNLKHTKKGYKLRLPVIIIASVSASAFFGILFFGVGFGRALDNVLGERMPFYERFINPKMMMWESPEKGRLAGLVAGRLSDCEYQLLDRLQKEWVINIEGTRNACELKLEIGRPVKMIGALENELGNLFIVEQILPHGPGQGMFNRHYDLPPDRSKLRRP